MDELEDLRVLLDRFGKDDLRQIRLIFDLAMDEYLSKECSAKSFPRLFDHRFRDALRAQGRLRSH